MRVAIVTWNKSVSPVFETASRLVLIDVEQREERARRTIEMPANLSPLQRARRLAELEVNVLICGAISRPLEELVSTTGVVVIPWVAGPVEGILRAYLTRRLSAAHWRMRGVRRRSRHAEAPVGPRGHGRT